MNETHRFNVAGMSVAIGMPTKGDIPPQTVLALASTASDCAKAGVRLDIYINVCGVLQWGRDDVVAQFLVGAAQKLFWIDSDMVWETADFLRLVALSTVRDVVGATYPAKVEGSTMFYVLYEDNTVSQEYGLMSVNGMGLGFTVVDRAVLQALSDKAPLVEDQLGKRMTREIFRFTPKDGQRTGEDMAFFADIRALGHQVWLDPSIELGHVGQRQWRGRLQDALQSPDTTIVRGAETRKTA